MRKCPRENCGGDLFWEIDDDGKWIEKCFLCSRIALEYLIEPLAKVYGGVKENENSATEQD